MSFSARLRQALEIRGWNQGELAEAADLSPSTVSQWAKGKRTPGDGEPLDRVARSLETTTEWLLRGEGREPAGARQHAISRLTEVVKWVARRAHIDGGRDGGNATQFTIRPSIGSLVRESIQNIVDEWLGSQHGPARVRFRLLSLRGEAKGRYLEAMRWSQFRPHIEACVAQAQDQQVAGGLREALEVADSGELLVLQIIDANTRGLVGPEHGEGNFAALTRDNLFSEKNSPGAGGSYGLGKAMQYAASAFGCVLFSSELVDPAPETDKTSGRFFGRAELVWHMLEGDERGFSGPMWLGEEPEAEMPVSHWADGGSILLRDLHMARQHGATGTTIAVVGLRDLDADRARHPREIVEQIAQEAEHHFWPAIEAGELEVRVEFVEVRDPDAVPAPEVDRVVVPEHSSAVAPLADALRAHREDQTVDTLVDDGDVVRGEAELRVPARRVDAGGGTHDSLVHTATVLVRRATIDELADEVARRTLRQGALLRGANMVVKSLDLSRGALGAHPYQVVVLAGLAAGDTADDEHAEIFLRAAEPPSHDDWIYTPRLRQQYAAGSKKALSEFESSIRRTVRELLSIETDQAPDGPRDLSRRFRFGEPRPPERAPSIVLQSHRVEEDGSVRIEAAVRRRDDLGKQLSGEPILTFLKESGGRGRVRWAELTPVGDGVAVEDGKTLHISPNTRTARFRAVSDPTSHPAPAREAAATVAFLPGREES
jgi:transcriptional regulator with XRE-family HTH domain